MEYQEIFKDLIQADPRSVIVSIDQNLSELLGSLKEKRRPTPKEIDRCPFLNPEKEYVLFKQPTSKEEATDLFEALSLSRCLVHVSVFFQLYRSIHVKALEEEIRSLDEFIEAARKVPYLEAVCNYKDPDDEEMHIFTRIEGGFYENLPFMDLPDIMSSDCGEVEVYGKYVIYYDFLRKLHNYIGTGVVDYDNDLWQVRIKKSPVNEAVPASNSVCESDDTPVIINSDRFKECFNIIKDFFADSQHGQLEELLKGNLDIEPGLVFLEPGNKMIDFFLRLYSSHIIVGVTKTILAKWICLYFKYKRGSSTVPFDYNYVYDSLTMPEKACKNPLININKLREIEVVGRESRKKRRKIRGF